MKTWDTFSKNIKEHQQLDEIAPLIAGGLALGGALAAGAAIKRARDAAKSGVDAANKGKEIKNPGTGIAGAAYGMQRHNNALRDAMKQLNQSHELEGSLIEGRKKDDSYLETDMKKRQSNNEKALADMKKTKGYKGMVDAARRHFETEEVEYIEEKGMSKDEMSSILKGHKYSKQQLLDMSKKSTKEGRHGEAAAFYHEFQKEDTQIDEDKEYRREMAKAAARERAEERKEKGKKAAKIPGRLGISSGTSYADKQELSIKGHDKVTKGKHIAGYPFAEQVENIDEMAVSKAQQRFMGMVRAEQEGKMKGASPAVKKAAKSMTAKQAHDFAATKHKGLPEKKEETKEELSLVDRLIAEATDAQWMAAKARREERQKKQQKRLKVAKTSVAANQVLNPKESTASTPRGKGSKSSIERAAATTAAGRTKSKEIEGKYKLAAEKEKTSRQKQRFERSDLEKKEKARRNAEEEKKKAKQDRKKALKRDIVNAWNTQTKVAGDKKDTEAVSAGISNLGNIAAGVAKTGIALGKYAWKKRKERKEEEKQKKEEQNQKEQFSNWREEFIFEVDDQSVQNEPQQKIIDVTKKKNKIEINPNMSEDCGCDEKKEKTAKKDMRSLSTDVNIEKNKIRSMGIKNPIVMVGVKEDWQSVNRKDKTDGLSQKAVDAYRRENPGSKLKTAVTEKNPTGKRADRRASFCRRMGGMKDKLTSEKTARDPDSRINKALRRWNCH